MAQDEKTRDDDKRRDDADRARAEPLALVPDEAGNVVVEAIVGPYRGQRLTMPFAEGDQARDDHWVINPFDPVAYDHPPLTDEERTASHEAATAWAQAQWDAAQGVEDEAPPPEADETDEQRRARQQRNDEHNRRQMQPDDPAGYPTRGQPQPQPTPRRPAAPIAKPETDR